MPDEFAEERLVGLLCSRSESKGKTLMVMGKLPPEANIPKRHLFVVTRGGKKTRKSKKNRRLFRKLRERSGSMKTKLIMTPLKNLQKEKRRLRYQVWTPSQIRLPPKATNLTPFQGKKLWTILGSKGVQSIYFLKR